MVNHGEESGVINKEKSIYMISHDQSHLYRGKKTMADINPFNSMYTTILIWILMFTWRY
jgi:hypothetical protein